MPYVDKVMYCNFGDGSTTGYWALPMWTASTAYTAGQIVRRRTASTTAGGVWVCIIAGTSSSAEPAWTNTRGALRTDGTVTWQECSGAAGMNGDVANTPDWNAAKSIAIPLGQVIKNNAGTHYFICSVAGTAGSGSEPSWDTTAGATTTDNTITWRCLGAVGNFSAWGAPITRLSIALNQSYVTVAGVTLYVGSNHVETLTGTANLNGIGTVTQAAPLPVLCVDSSVVNPGSSALRTTASLTATSLNFINGPLYVYGIAFNISQATGDNGVNFSTGPTGVLKNCSISFTNAAATGGTISLTNVLLDNTPVAFTHASQTIRISGGSGGWVNTPNPIAGTMPTTLFTNNGVAIFRARGLDFSGLGSGNTLTLLSSRYSRLSFVGCKLPSSITLFGSPSSGVLGTTCDVVNSDSAATNYLMSRGMNEGTLTTETTIIRTGGATDGVTPVSWKVVTSSFATWLVPFDCPQMTIWNETTGSNVVVTVFGIWGGAAVPNNDDVWMEVDYTGSTLTPQMTTLVLTKGNPLAAGTALASDTSTWGGSVTPFKLTTTLSSPQPGLKGPIYIRVRCGKPSTTFYIDPKPVLS